LRADEFEAGKVLLGAKFEHHRPELIIFTFKKTATVLCGRFAGNGFVRGVEVARIPGFVMPGPYEKAERVRATLRELREGLDGNWG
jgi:hypothetical protein